jgi:hypothetical protein
MLTQPLLDKLVQLRLPAFRAALEEQLHNPQYADLPFEGPLAAWTAGSFFSWLRVSGSTNISISSSSVRLASEKPSSPARWHTPSAVTTSTRATNARPDSCIRSPWPMPTALTLSSSTAWRVCSFWSSMTGSGIHSPGRSLRSCSRSWTIGMIGPQPWWPRRCLLPSGMPGFPTRRSLTRSSTDSCTMPTGWSWRENHVARPILPCPCRPVDVQ